MYQSHVPPTPGGYGPVWDNQFCLRLLNQPIFCEHHVHKDYVYAAHQHTGIEFLYCQSGHGFLTMENKTFPITAPTLVQITSTIPHSLAVNGTYARWNICIQPDVLRSLLDQAEQPSPLSTITCFPGLHMVGVPQQYLRRLENLFIDIGDEVSSKLPLYQQMATIKLQELSYVLERLILERNQLHNDSIAAMQSNQVEQLTHILNYIEANLDSKLTAQSIAEVFHYSEKHVYRLINQLTGQSLGSYLKQQRMYRAQALLISTDLRVAAVGSAVGIADPAQFARAFREVFDASPSHLREVYRTSQQLDHNPSTANSVSPKPHDLM